MSKIKLLKWTTVLLLLTMLSCREEFDNHYHSIGNSTIGKNVTQVLEEKGGFSLFLQMIRRANLERTLGESGLYTCLAPRDKDVEAFLQENGFTVETMPLETLIRYINYHFISGMLYQYNFEKKYEGFKDNKDYYISYAQQVLYTTRGDDNNPPKFIRVFTRPYFAARAYDYKMMRGFEGNDFMVENARISAVDRDIPTSNGVIHVLEDRLPFALRADEALAADPELSIMMRWFDRFIEYESKGMDNSGNIDPTRIKHYNVTTVPTTNRVLDIANEKSHFVFIAPTDAAIRQALDPYMNENQLVDYDSIPDILVIAILKGLTATTTTCFGIGDITRNNPYFYTTSGTLLSLQNDIAGMYKAPLLSSNGIIYKVNRMPAIPIMQSVEAGLYINHKRYKEWGKMLENGKLVPALTDDISYQHPSKTILIQPDNAGIWVNPTGNGSNGIDGFQTNYLDTLAKRMRAGVLEVKVENGAFEHRFYQSPYGYILYEDNHLIDYKGNKVSLISTTPTWNGSNGSIYEIDGLFQAMLNSSTDTTEFIYRSHIKDAPDFSMFNYMLVKTGQTKLLDAWNGNSYTVFAPTDAAFNASGYTGGSLMSMSVQELQKLLYRHIVIGRRIFTDGMTSGPISAMSSETLNISGAWENFRVTTQYGGTQVLDSYANKQASNGVFHGVSRVITQ